MRKIDNGYGLVPSVVEVKGRMLLLGRSGVRYNEMLTDLQQRIASYDGNDGSMLWVMTYGGLDPEQLAKIGGDHNLVMTLTDTSPTTLNLGWTWSSAGEPYTFEAVTEKTMTLRFFTLDGRSLTGEERITLNEMAYSALRTIAETSGVTLITIEGDAYEREAYLANPKTEPAVMECLTMPPEEVKKINDWRAAQHKEAVRSIFSIFGEKVANEMAEKLANEIND